MTTFRTVTGDLEAVLGTDLRQPLVSVAPNMVAGQALVDLDNNKVYLGSDRVSLTNGNTFSIQLIDTAGAGTNVTDGSLRWTIHVEYTDGRGKRKVWECANFELTADLDLSDLVPTADPPATVGNQYVAQMQALLDEATAIVGLPSEDAAVQALINNISSLTRTALSAAYAPGGTEGNIGTAQGDVRYVGKYAVYDVVKDGGADPTGATGDLGAIINTAYAYLLSIGGGVILIPPGDYRQTTAAVVADGRKVRVVGYGSALTRIHPTSALAGLVVLDINGQSTFTVWQAAQHGGFSIDGTNCPTATGLNYGDLVGGHLDDIDIDNFNGKGGIGLQFINRSHWTERTRLTRVVLGRSGGNSVNRAFTVSGSPYASFGYTREEDVRINLWAMPVTVTVASVTLTAGSTSATVASGGFPGVSNGMAVQASTAAALQGATTVSNVSGNTLTLSMPASSSGTVTLYFAPAMQIGYQIGQDAQVYHSTFRTIFNCTGGVAGTSLWPLVMFNNAQNTSDTGRGFMQNEIDWIGETDNHTVAFISANASSSTQCYGRIQFPGPSLHKYGTNAVVRIAGDLWMPGLLGPDGAHDATVGGLRKFSNVPGDYTLSSYVVGAGNYESWVLTDDGKLLAGSGSAAFDVGLKRIAAGLLGITDGSGNTKRALTGVPVFSFPSGTYFYPAGSANTGTSTHVNNQFRATPAYIPQAITITKIGAEVTAAGNSGAVLRLGIYADNNGLPGSLVLDAGTIAADAVGVGEITLGTPLTLQPGWYWFGGAAQNAATTAPTTRTCGIGAATAASGFLLGAGTSTPLASQAVAGLFDSTASGALAASFTNSGPTGSPLRVFLKLQ